MRPEDYPRKPGTAKSPTNRFSEDAGEAIDEALVGTVARYQLAFSGSPTEMLLDSELRFADVTIRQTREPFRYQYTDVLTIAGAELPIEAEITHRLWSRPGQFVTVASTGFEVPSTGMSLLILQARERCEAALGVVAAALDERFIDRRIGEFVSAETADGPALMDTTHGMRSFDPTLSKLTADEVEFGTSQLLSGPLVQSAFKFYVKGVEQRLTEVGYILLATTADMLAGGKNRLKPYDLKQALERAGEPPDKWSMGRVRKVTETRGKLVHNGMIPTKEMYESWYDLEEMVRVLLRHKLGIKSNWPARVPMYEGPAFAPDTLVDEDPAPERTEV